MPSGIANAGDSPATAAGFGPRLGTLVRARWPQIAVYLLVLLAIDMVRNYSLRTFSAEQFLADGLRPVLAIAVAVAGGSIAGTLVAEAMALRGIARAVAILALAIAGAALGHGVIWLIDSDMLVPAAQRDAGLTQTAFLLRNLWYYTATALLLAAYFVMRDREIATTRLAQAAELERGSVQRAVMESRLKVLQARVEPELLFDVLADVQRLYASAPPRAEALLDDLIVYLRAALPQMRGDASTLGREAALAGAYVKVTPATREGTLRYAERIPDALADVPFPPMVLLPLVHAAADARAASVTLAAGVDATADAVNATVWVEVRVPPHTRVNGWSSDRLGAMREVVASYYGENTSLEVVDRADNAAAALRFPVPRTLVASAPAAGM